ncbi:MAG: hypothetical protein ACFFA3_17555 [Promethearchaeota archaeon]
MVNSESRLLGNLVKKDRIDFTSEVVEKVYELLSFSEKYFVDENGILWERDPIGVARSVLEEMGYLLDALWYSWGTLSPTKIGETDLREFNLIEFIENSGQSFSNIYEGISETKDGLIIRGSETMKQLVFNKDLNPVEIRIAILKNLMDSELVEILKKENPNQYGDLQTNQFNRILEALGINKKINELTDADLMDIARKRFKWTAYDEGNVAYFIYKLKLEGGQYETGVFFAISGSQELLGVKKDKNKNWDNYAEILKQSSNGREIINILNSKLLKKAGSVGGFMWHSEIKISMAFMEKIKSNLNTIEEIELCWASERGYCSGSCNPVLQNLIEYLDTTTSAKRISYITRNDVISIKKGVPWTDYGIRGEDFNYRFLDIYMIKRIISN